jgi:hypothetical protein
MSFSRRGFGAALAAALAGGWGARSNAYRERPGREAFRAGNLEMSFTGLCLFQYKKPNGATLYPVTVHYVKNGQHKPRIMARLIDVDLKSSAEDFDVAVLPTGEQAGIWDLPKEPLTFEGLRPDALDYATTGSSECPTDGDWSSFYWLPDLRDAFGAQSVDKQSGAWGGSVEIASGSLWCEMPFNSTGATAKWKLHPNATVTRAMSDRVTYNARTSGNTVTLKAGSSKLLTLKTRGNEPSRCAVFSLVTKVTGGAGMPHLEHLKMFKDMLKSPTKDVEPTGVTCAGSPFTQVEPIYCPPGHFPEP